MSLKSSLRTRIRSLLLSSLFQAFGSIILTTAYLTLLVSKNGFQVVENESTAYSNWYWLKVESYTLVLTWILVTGAEFTLSVFVLFLTQSKPRRKYRAWLIYSILGLILRTILIIYFYIQSNYVSVPVLGGGTTFLLLSLITILVMSFLMDCIPPLIPDQEESFIKHGRYKRMKILRNKQGRAVSHYYNTKTQDPVNLELGDIDEIYHHHYGIGEIEPSFFTTKNDNEIKIELHRLETAQANCLFDNLGSLEEDDRVLDSGCGRGGSSIMVAERFGCFVDGISLSDYQVQFATEIAKKRNLEKRVTFHFCNMLNTKFSKGTFKAVWNNESTMYVRLEEYFLEVRRILVPGGRYVCVTGAWTGTKKSVLVKHIDKHYSCNTHNRNDYLKALIANGFVIVTVTDLTDLTLPYWKLRAKSSLTTPIDQYFIDSYSAGEFKYLMIVADKL